MAPPIRLVTIKGSHYCERARWALDLAQIRYEEECHAPALHMRATMSLRPQGCTSTSVPLAVIPEEGLVLTDSTDIVLYAANHAGEHDALGLYPSDPALRTEVEAVEAVCLRMGAWVRVLLYRSLFTRGTPAAAVAALKQGVHGFEAGVFSWLFPLFKVILTKGMIITEDNAKRSLEKLRPVWADLSARLEKSKYLVGDSFTAADLTFAAMAALLVLNVENYGADLAGLEEFMLPELLAEFRYTPAGRHVADMYARFRPRPAAPAPSATAARAGHAADGGEAMSGAARL